MGIVQKFPCWTKQESWFSSSLPLSAPLKPSLLVPLVAPPPPPLPPEPPSQLAEVLLSSRFWLLELSQLPAVLSVRLRLVRIPLMPLLPFWLHKNPPNVTAV